MTTARQFVHAYETGLGRTPSAATDEPDPGARLAATLPVWALAAGSVAAAAESANRFRAAVGLPTVPVRLEPARIAAAFGSERLFRRHGRAPSVFAELSGFFRTRDGWIRTHANYPHHRERLAAAVGLPADASAEAASARFATMSAAEIEALAHAGDAIAVRVRAQDEWAASPQGIAAAAGPLVAIALSDGAGQSLGPASSPESRGGAVHPGATVAQPLRGLRVLDLTRVLAGPVATRTLALLGADVLRVDPPHLPEIEWQFQDTCQGKRSTLLDLRADPEVFAALLAEADVLVTGYRPGASATADLRAAEHAGLIHARVSAWGETGPWGARRGFDSIVQAASGIALIEGGPDRPGALPAQALDHGSGYLLAAGVLDALRDRLADGRGREVRVSLARTGAWLLATGHRDEHHPAAEQPDPCTAVTHDDVTTAAPAFADYADYFSPAPPYGSAQPFWPKRPA
ncbi:CoA transferase [Nocardia neocaledoniensis]|uniref:CoA transferase n=1 Tax=Nocardia neocaledoniensis TaxID=236511 RepID=UPI0024587293|nr:CoA transferase [Nocardia neocaledoniensis]